MPERFFVWTTVIFVLLSIALISGGLFAVQKLGGVNYLLLKLRHGEDATGVTLGRTEHYESLARPAPDAVVFVGDSITDQVEWSEVFPRHRVISRAIPGLHADTLAKWLPSVTVIQPKQVFLLVGTNDVNGVSAQEAAERVLVVVRNIRQASPSTQLVVQAIMPVNNSVRETNRSNAVIQEANAIIQDGISSDSAIVWADIYGAMADESGALDHRFTHDGLHLSGAGIAHWVESIRPLVEH